MARKDIMYRLVNCIVNGHNLLPPGPITYAAKIIEMLLGLLLFIGLLTRISSGIVMIIMLVAIATSMTNIIDFGNAWEALAKILFWFAAIFLVYGGGKWSSDNYLLLKKENAEKYISIFNI